MALETRMLALAAAVGNDIKMLSGLMGNMTLLETTNKSEFVASINELVLNIQAINEFAADQYARFNDAIVTVDNIYSTDKLVSLLATLKSEILADAPATYDTLKEIADYIAINDVNIQNFLTQLGGAVAVTPQTLTEPQQVQAQRNIDVLAPAEVGSDIALIYAIAADNVTYMAPGYVMPGYVA